MEIYAELAGDGKRQGIKSPCGNRLKTMENGIIGTYIAGFSGYSYGKLFTAATKKRQARIAWEEMAKFIQIDPDLQELFSVKDYKSMITAKGTFCTVEALSRESGLEDGHRAIKRWHVAAMPHENPSNCWDPLTREARAISR